MDSVIIRTATNNDLPSIWQLILDSYIAIIDSTHEAFLPYFEKAGYSVRESDLKDVEQNYSLQHGAQFWVADHVEHGVVGCVALKRINADEAELKRMAVNPKMRSLGIGKKLVDNLLAFAYEQKFSRIILTTINKRAAQFYKTCGFVSIRERNIPMPPAENVVGFSMVFYLADKLIRRVAILGGTHGNERLGVTLVQAWLEDAKALQHSTFSANVLITNEEATKRNVRYVDTDLNRCFTSGSPPAGDTVEGKRAAELLELLGPKSADGADCKTDFIIDMHSTTSNMGLSLVLNAEHDVFARRVAHSLAQSFPALKLTGSLGSKAETWSIDSISPSGLSIEVGPLAHGTIDFDLLDKTRSLVFATLDYIEQHNQRLLSLASAGASVASFAGRELVVSRDVAPPLPFPSLPFYQRAATVDYPRDKDGRLSGFINPTLLGKDWSEIASEESVFVDISGKGVPAQFPSNEKKDVPPFVSKAPPKYYGIFINEAAYYEKGIALALCELTELPVY